MLFLYPQTQNNVALQATFSVVMAVSAALGSFFGWHENRATYKAQEIALASVIGEWELDLIELLEGDIPDKKGRALGRTRRAMQSLFDALSWEHETFFASTRTPQQIVSEASDRNGPDRNQRD